MKKINGKLRAEVILLIIFGIFFLSYSNVTSHRTINKLIVKAFLSKNNKGDFSMDKFKNYHFDFTKPKLAGNKIIKSGYFNPSKVPNIGDVSLITSNSTYTEAERKISPLEWIIHGGYSADEPEVPASLRHFYDPTRRKGKRYLTDKLNSKAFDWAESFLANPHTNGVDWALGEQGNFGVLEHNYTWENGKKYLQGALETANPDSRKKYMAKAWRSLGETLHMIADNGCPAHVRNDGHPSIPIPLLSYFGNPDPYEEQMAVYNIANFDGGPVPKSESEKFRAAKTTRDIAHQMAVFTNKNFFTNETISGIDWKGNKVKPITHPDYVYKSPKLSADQYNGTYYIREIEDGISMKMCTDVQFFMDAFAYKTYPYLDEECVKSQAKVLIPIIKEAGINVVKLFIPKLKIVINSVDDEGNIKGEILHSTDKEYKSTIKYNGPVSIKTITLEEVANLEANNGKFSGRIENTDLQVFAEIEFGGISIRSENKETSFTKPKSETNSFKGKKIDEVLFEINARITTTEGEKELSSFTRNSFDNEGKVQTGSEEGNFEIGKITSSGINITAQNTRADKSKGGGHYRSSETNTKKQLVLMFDDSENLTGFQFNENYIGIYGKEKETVTEKYVIKVNNVPFKKNSYESSGKTYFSYSYKGDISPYLIQCDGVYPATFDKTICRFIKPDKNWRIDISVICDE